jgi:hypothetical protein
LLQGYAQEKPLPSGVAMGKQAIQQAPEAAIGGMAGPVAGKLGGLAISGIGKLAKQGLGSLEGVGSGAVEEALKGTPSFRAALRGKISPDEIVENTRNALSYLKSQRSVAYQRQLADFAANQGPIDISPLKQDTMSLLKQYVQIGKNGQPNWTRSALGPSNSEGVKKIRDIVKTIQGWGSQPGDDTVLGLDMLKRQLDDFYSESSNARSFVAALRKNVKDRIVEAAPSYGQMTRSYSEATKLIRDVESGLMLRKQGISGRIIADQTLRRLTSAMRDNFVLRRELVNILGQQSGQDLAGQIAGQAMSSVIPRGLPGSGIGVGMGTIAGIINPKFWPVLIASSPRVSAEFLMLFGQGMKQTPGLTQAGAKFLSYLGASQQGKE